MTAAIRCHEICVVYETRPTAEEHRYTCTGSGHNGYLFNVALRRKRRRSRQRPLPRTAQSYAPAECRLLILPT